MAKLVFGMNLSLDGYVDHEGMSTGPALFGHWTEQVGGLTGSVYGRRMYEIMRYWDEDRPEWSTEQWAFAAAWRRQPKWVVSRSLKSVGPNATLVADDVAAVIRGLKARLGSARRGDRRFRAEPGGQPDRARSRRRISALFPPRRARSWHAVLRRAAATPPPRIRRSRRRGRGQVDLRSRLNARLAGKTATTAAHAGRSAHRPGSVSVTVCRRRPSPGSSGSAATRGSRRERA
ncbi:hypothetical protein ABIE65_004403 [Constrictibacter sp. MBR-5]|jgi:hypothetical protein